MCGRWALENYYDTRRVVRTSAELSTTRRPEHNDVVAMGTNRATVVLLNEVSM